ncbi:MAG TPA: NAD(P)/FAD-dependent oxidoreductase [Ilumatobacteraceae bacterium]|nr:NAD(P)/FAD-dependent oxidoreductase [Ilumatobacteraceae bacterium]
MDRPWDCIVIGGGAAGLSAALVLGRARRRTLVVDDGRQSNLAAHGIGGLLGHDGRPPAELYAAARAELAGYPSVELVTGTVVSAERAEDGFLVAVAGGGRHAARRLLLATGMDYRAADVPGVAERWGRSVFHCPFCHGWEVRDRPLGVLDRGADAVHRALLLRAWSDDVTVLTDGPPELDEDAIAQLAAAGVAVDERRVEALRGPGSELTDVVFTDGSARSLGGLLVPVVLHQRSPLAARLGATIAPPGMLAADAVDVDAWLQTPVPGVAAAGDVTGTMPSVANAIAAGSNAAAAIVRSLVVEPPPAE